MHFLKTVLSIFLVACFAICKAQPCNLTMTTSSTSASCGNSNAFIRIIVSFGTPPFFYSLSGGAFQTSNTFSNLVTGLYTVAVQDSLGCMAQQNVTIYGSLVNSWTGAMDSTWENPSNWSCHTIPNDRSMVQINSGPVIVNSNTIVYSLSISPGVVFTVNPGFNITVLH